VPALSAVIVKKKANIVVAVHFTSELQDKGECRCAKHQGLSSFQVGITSKEKDQFIHSVRRKINKDNVNKGS
jgi:hypothetical protein